MENDQRIADFHRELKLKKSFMGYDTCAVLDSYKKLDALYQEILEAEKAELLEQIRILTEAVLRFEQETKEKETQLELQRQVILVQAKQEAQALLEQKQAEQACLISAARGEISLLEKRKKTMIEQLRQVNMLVSDQLRALAPDEAEEK